MKNNHCSVKPVRVQYRVIIKNLIMKYSFSVLWGILLVMQDKTVS